MSLKERAIRAIQELPEDADFEAVSEKLEFIQAVDQGLQQVKARKTLSAEQLRQRLSRWLSELPPVKTANSG